MTIRIIDKSAERRAHVHTDVLIHVRKDNYRAQSLYRKTFDYRYEGKTTETGIPIV